MKENLKIGVIGLGNRGLSLLEQVMLEMDDIEILAVCDHYEDRVESAACKIKEKKGYSPFGTGNYKEILAMAEIDAVIISSSWADHTNIAINAMKAGKYAAMEVGGAYSVEECWRLVHTYEETGVPCMMLENCCYGRREMMILNMVNQGILGEIIHCEGGYLHDLRSEIVNGKENRHYRLVNYLNRNCENYPTHEIGPIAQILNINRGNRMVSLTSVASKSAGLHQYILSKKEPGHYLENAKFIQGDIVTTTIKCARGETISITLDTTLPRPYSRGFTVKGTKGMYSEANDSIFLDNVHDEFHMKWEQQWGNAKEYEEEYDHPLWKKYIEDGVKGGHAGMDWLVFKAFFDSVKKGTQTPIDIYDTASLMSISALSEQSISLGGAPVFIPDFTNGRWMRVNPD